MGSVAEFFKLMFNSIGALAPAGIDPTLFFTTFFVVFAIIFTGLSTVKVFGDTTNNNKIRAIFAFVAAYFTATSAFATIMISKLFPNLGIVLISVIVMLVVTSFVSSSGKPVSGGFLKVIMLLLVVWIIWNSWNSATLEVYGYKTKVQVSAQDMADIVLVILFIIIFLKVLGVGGNKSSGGNTLKDFLGDLLKG